MSIFRVKARWQGFSGAPGYTILHFGDGTEQDGATPDSAVVATRAFFQSLSGLLAPGVSISIENAVEELETGSGQMQTIHTTASVTPVTASGAGTYAAPVGAVVNWITNEVRNGRRVRGKTFLVPMSSSIYQADGTLATAHMATIQQAAEALIADANSLLCVYARPETGTTNGRLAPVTGARVPDMAAVLRSRRD